MSVFASSGNGCCCKTDSVYIVASMTTTKTTTLTFVGCRVAFGEEGRWSVARRYGCVGAGIESYGQRLTRDDEALTMTKHAN